ncbi:MAG: metallophosphoesterase [Nocardioides sp.]
MRPARVDPDGQPARVVERRRRSIGGALRDRRGTQLTSRRVVQVLALVGTWFVCALIAGTLIFLTSSRDIVLASHDAELRPDLGGQAVLRTGPVLPDVRIDTGTVIGVEIKLGKTDAASTSELVERYALLGGQPEGQIDRVTEVVQDMMVDAALRGAVLGLLPVAIWLLLGPRRRRDLRHSVGLPQAMLGIVLGVLVSLALWQPWQTGVDAGDDDTEWMPLADLLGTGVPLPEGLTSVQVSGDLTTSQTRRLIESAVDTYDTSQEFYADAAERAESLPLREPEEDETVVVFVSDRHDNIGMDPVARAIGDAAGATGVFDGGDDTSTGSTWEAFSLDSVSAAFDGLDRWAVAGNHDHGDFVQDYLADQGWTMLDGEVVTGPGDSTLLGVPDPRSSGLGNWRDETGLTFGDVEDRLADEACATEERLSTMLVHDANLGREALARGCVDLVLGGHTHVRSGPERIEGVNGESGYRYTTGTAGGAAYAIALGSKPRRAADVSLVTYRDGRPVGIQWVTLQTDGSYQTGPYVPLTFGDPEDAEDTEDTEDTDSSDADANN